MKVMNLIALLLTLIHASSVRADSFGSGPNVFDIEFVDIGEPGNLADPAEISLAGGASPSGTVGQGGNVSEWVESEFIIPSDPPSSSRLYRGGGWETTALGLTKAFAFVGDPFFESHTLGFRVASLPEVSPFSTIINVPPDEAPDSIGSDTQLNLFDGGVLGDFFDGVTSGNIFHVGDPNGTSTNVEVNIVGGLASNFIDAHHGSVINISGGTVGSGLDAYSDSIINISGGRVGHGFEARTGSEVMISGGSIGDEFGARRDSRVTLTGGEFRKDGVLINGLESTGNTVSPFLLGDFVLSGTFSDGRTFAFSGQDGDSFYFQSLTLEATALPPVGSVRITASTDPIPLGLREGQTLRVDEGGLIPDNFNSLHSSTVNIEAGGHVGSNFEAVGTIVNISGGTIGDGFDAFEGSVVTITGGLMGDNFATNSGSMVMLAGGTMGDSFRANRGSQIEIFGGEFRLDGVLVSGLESEGSQISMDVPSDSLFTGTLIDGTPFIFYGQDDNGDHFTNGVLTLIASNLPPVEPITITSSMDEVPLGIRQGQTLQVDDGGVVADDFVASRGSIVNVGAGGTVGDNLEAVGAMINISGGIVGERLDAFDGSILNISGGTIGGNLEAHEGSEVHVVAGSVLSFDAKRGSLVAISGGSVDGFVAFSGSSIDITGGSVGYFSSRSGSTVSISGGSAIEKFATSGAVNILGGTVGDNADAKDGSMVTITGGAVGDRFDADAGSTVNISGGMVGDDFDANEGSTVNVSGGSVGDSFEASSGSTVNITRGAVGDNFRAYNGSLVTISGGSVGDSFKSFNGGTVKISGGDFRLNGVLVSGLETSGNIITLDEPIDYLTGTFSDGTPFAFSRADCDCDTFGGSSDQFSGELILKATVLPPVGPVRITASTDPLPRGIRQGQTLMVDNGGIVPENFSAGFGSKVIVEAGGSMGTNFEAVAADVNIASGSIDAGFDAFDGSTIFISGGSIGTRFSANNGSVVTMTGGSIGDNFDVLDGSKVNISGGSVGALRVFRNGEANISGGSFSSGSFGSPFPTESGSEVNISGGTFSGRFRAYIDSEVKISGGTFNESFTAQRGSIVNISGGSFVEITAHLSWDSDDLGGSLVNLSGGSFNRFNAYSGSHVNLLGTKFQLDGVDITSTLVFNVPLTIDDRDVTLSGLLADGSPFIFDLNSTFVSGADHFNTDAHLTVTLIQVPEPTQLLLALWACAGLMLGKRQPTSDFLRGQIDFS